MKIVLLVVGSTKEQYLIDGFVLYQERLKHYVQFDLIEVPNKNYKNLSKVNLKRKEEEGILKYLAPSDYVVLLDERGESYTSIRFADKLQKWMLSAKKRVVFVVGGAYGFSDNIYARANEKISLSKMTFSHQMVRLFFLEQIYRGYTILNNEPYHNK